MNFGVRPCNYPGCPQLVSSGRCPEHTKAADKAIPRRGSEVYGTTRWKKMRTRVLKEQAWCASCGVNLSLHVDHIQPLGTPGVDPFDRSNLQGLCARCHSRKTAREVWHQKLNAAAEQSHSSNQ